MRVRIIPGIILSWNHVVIGREYTKYMKCCFSKYINRAAGSGPLKIRDTVGREVAVAKDQYYRSPLHGYDCQVTASTRKRKEI